jgi:hypothetical protein
MALKIYGPRKRRTRQHVIADLGVHHVEGFILEEGYTAERIDHDYGYDLVMRTFDERGFVEPGRVYFQIKASERLQEVHGNYQFDLDIRDYNLWMCETTAVILVIYDAGSGNACWQDIQRYFLGHEARLPKKGTKWVRVRIPASQAMSRDAIAELRRQKNEDLT